MRLISVYLVFLLPFLASALITKYDPIQINSASLIYQKYYMFDKLTTPASNNIGHNQSFLDMTFNITKNLPDVPSRGTIEAFFTTEEFFNKVGYTDDKGRKIACCDESVVKQKCQNLNHLIIPDNMNGHFKKMEKHINGTNDMIHLHYDIPKEGKYYMILAICDPATANFNITGETVVMNPYGHIPARLYGLLPFTKLLMLSYSILTVIWIFRCCNYHKELMSVHFVISIVMVVFMIDTFVKLLNITSYNTNGSYVTSITIVSLFIGAATRAISRCLTLMIAMGLGVSRASIEGMVLKIVVMSFVYFGFSLWDSISTTFATTSDVNMWRIIPASLVDSIIYYWILQSLLDTIQDLEDKKQTSKLEVFVSLRNMIIMVVIFSTIYNIGFSYLIVKNALESYWRYQWFFNDGVWSVFYFVIICSIMYLWAPNERSLAYAYHVQVSTDERPDVETVSMQDGELQSKEMNESIKVATIDSTLDTLKPMKM